MLLAGPLDCLMLRDVVVLNEFIALQDSSMTTVVEHSKAHKNVLKAKFYFVFLSSSSVHNIKHCYVTNDVWSNDYYAEGPNLQPEIVSFPFNKPRIFGHL